MPEKGSRNDSLPGPCNARDFLGHGNGLNIWLMFRQESHLRLGVKRSENAELDESRETLSFLLLLSDADMTPVSFPLEHHLISLSWWTNGE